MGPVISFLLKLLLCPCEVVKYVFPFYTIQVVADHNVTYILWLTVRSDMFLLET